MAGARGGALAGRTVAVKDTYAVAGHPIGAGHPAWLAEAPVEPRSAPVVQHLLDAGADVLGIVQTVELAYSLSGVNVHYGTPPNAAAPGRLPGGSSSGSASAVASGSVDIGLGSDTAGSIRVPASYCGLHGFRASHGALPTEGLVPLAPGFDTVGWLTREAETLDAVARVLLPEQGDAAAPARVVVATDLFALAEPGVQSALAGPTSRFAARAGLPVEEVSLLEGHRVDDWVEAFATVQAAQAWSAHGAWIQRHPGALSPEIAQRFDRGRRATAAEVRGAEAVLTQVRRVLADVVTPGTVLLQPAASTPAPAPGMSEVEVAAMRAGTLRLTCPASIAGLPVVTVPAGRVDGLPVGLCVVGRRGSDRMLSSLAARAARPDAAA